VIRRPFVKSPAREIGCGLLPGAAESGRGPPRMPRSLATSIAAISFVGRRLDQPGRMLWSGLLYVVGRLLAYLALALVSVTSLLSAPVWSQRLQIHIGQLLGLPLLLTGMGLLDLLPVPLPGI
jgi:hypothetical protein